MFEEQDKLTKFVIRLLYSAYFYATFTLIAFLFYIWGLGFARDDQKKWRYLALKGVDLTFFLTGIKVHVDGYHIPDDGPYIYCANHQSFLDGLILLHVLKQPFNAITGPYQIFPFMLRPWFRKMGYMAVARDLFEQLKYDDVLTNRESIEKGVSILKRKQSLLIFPEGKRELRKRILPFHMGVTKMSIESEVPVVPMTLKNVDTLFPYGALLMTPTHLEVHIERPVKPWKRNADLLKNTLLIQRKIRRHLPKCYFREACAPSYPEGRRAAFFDIDGTLTRANIYQALLKRYMKRYFSWDDVPLLYHLAVNRIFLKHGFFYLSAIEILKGIEKDSLLQGFYSYLREHKKDIFYPEMLELLELHRMKGNLIFLITEEPHELMRPVFKLLDVKGFGTRLDIERNTFTGRINGPIMKDEVKRDLVFSLAKKHQIDLSKSFGYGNSWHDYPMLRTVGHAYLVRPARSLARRGRELGFKIID